MFNEKELNELIRCVEKEYYLNTKNKYISNLLIKLKNIKSLNPNSYKDTLYFVILNKFSPYKVFIADTVNCILPDLSNDKFERICEFVSYMYLKLDNVNLDDVVNTTKLLIDEKVDLSKITKHDFISRLPL